MAMTHVHNIKSCFSPLRGLKYNPVKYILPFIQLYAFLWSDLTKSVILTKYDMVNWLYSGNATLKVVSPVLAP